MPLMRNNIKNHTVIAVETVTRCRTSFKCRVNSQDKFATFIRYAFGITMFFIFFVNCLDETNPSKPDNVPPVQKAFSFSERFDGGLDSIKNRWGFFQPGDGAPGAGSTCFTLDTTNYFSPMRSMHAGLESGRSWMVNGIGGYSLYYGGELTLNDTISLPDTVPYKLTFYNKRSIMSISAFPNSGENSSACELEVSLNNTNWIRLLRLSTSTADWAKDEVTLEGYMGKNIFLRFRIPQHFTQGRSTHWWIDNIALAPVMM